MILMILKIGIFGGDAPCTSGSVHKVGRTSIVSADHYVGKIKNFLNVLDKRVGHAIGKIVHEYLNNHLIINSKILDLGFYIYFKASIKVI